MSSAGTKSGSSARSFWSCSPYVGRSVSRTARFRDQLQLDDESNSQIADGSDPGTTSVGDLPISSVSEPQLVPVGVFCANAPRRKPQFKAADLCFVAHLRSSVESRRDRNLLLYPLPAAFLEFSMCEHCMRLRARNKSTAQHALVYGSAHTQRHCCS